jgi:class 3 adenylate cyclase
MILTAEWIAPLTLLGEIALLSTVLCGLHALNKRFGLAPLYVVVGLFEAFLFVAGKGNKDPSTVLVAELFFAEPAHVSYMLFLPLILSSMVLVYVLEGVREVRRLLIALIILYVLHGAIDVILEFHALHPPEGYNSLAGQNLLYYSMGSRAAGLGAMIADFAVILVSYQFLQNRLRRLPLIIPLFVALILAMVCDAMVYSLLRGRLFSWDNVMFIEKLQAGIMAGLPVAIYLQWQLRKHHDDVRRGILERGAFAALDLRQRVMEMEHMLQEQKAQYRYIKDTFSRYVSPDVVNAIIADPTKISLGGELRTVTILFIDIRGYSTLSESLEPTEVIGLLNRYYRRISRVILDNGGMINEIEGDGMLAVFGAPLDLPDHGLRAVRTGLGMLDEVDILNDEWDEDGTSEQWRSVGIDRFTVRIGVHTGPVVAGNVGSEARMKYSVIGDTVNTASRVEGLNKELDTAILVTSTTRETIADSESIPWIDKGQHPVKGRTEPVSVFSVERTTASSG